MISIAATRLLSLVIISSPVCYQYKDVHLCCAMFALAFAFVQGLFCVKSVYTIQQCLCACLGLN